jgi:hypothetical protein
MLWRIDDIVACSHIGRRTASSGGVNIVHCARGIGKNVHARENHLHEDAFSRSAQIQAFTVKPNCQPPAVSKRNSDDSNHW